MINKNLPKEQLTKEFERLVRQFYPKNSDNDSEYRINMLKVVSIIKSFENIEIKTEFKKYKYWQILLIILIIMPIAFFFKNFILNIESISQLKVVVIFIIGCGASFFYSILYTLLFLGGFLIVFYIAYLFCTLFLELFKLDLYTKITIKPIYIKASSLILFILFLFIQNKLFEKFYLGFDTNKFDTQLWMIEYWRVIYIFSPIVLYYIKTIINIYRFSNLKLSDFELVQKYKHLSE